MSILFYILLLIWLLFGLYWNRSDIQGGNYGIAGGSLMLFLLFLLLGWRVFGAPLQ